MKIGVYRETAPGERRVALTPVGVAKVIALGHTVCVEGGAGVGSGITDSDFAASGAAVVPRSELDGVDVSLHVRGPGTANPDQCQSEPIPLSYRAGTVGIGLFDPLWQPHNAKRLAATGASVLALDLVPRITRAQSMDVLSSMATIAGYEAALLAAQRLPRMFPLMMTAAGTLKPARVLVLGAGVAGLQAIATARRLGAVVEAFDVRPAAAEQIRSLGAKAVELDLDTEQSEDTGGYATDQGEDSNRRQQRLLASVVANADVVITTAAIPGRRSPELLTVDMVAAMRRGSVVVDIAAERGGNCAATVADEEVDVDGVLVLGPTNLASCAPSHASQMLSSNIVALLTHLTVDGKLVIDTGDEITQSMLVSEGGQLVHDGVITALTGER